MKKKDINQQIKPPLKWAGGKRWIVPHILPIWEKYKNKRLVEPFAGGLAVTLGLMPEKAWINDINTNLINFYNQLKKGGAKVLNHGMGLTRENRENMINMSSEEYAPPLKSERGDGSSSA